MSHVHCTQTYAGAGAGALELGCGSSVKSPFSLSVSDSTSLSSWDKPDDEASDSIYKACGEAVTVLIVSIFTHINGKLQHAINHTNSIESLVI